MSNLPITFGEQEFLSFFSSQPSDVHGQATQGTQFYKRMFYQKLYSVFDFTIPEEWALPWFRFWLLHAGAIGLFNTDRFGWVDLPFSIREWSFDYFPKVIYGTNSKIGEYVKDIEGEVWKNAGIIYCFDDFYGFDDVISRYAEMMASADASINVNLINSRVAYIIEAQSKKEADSIGEMLDQVSTGKPIVKINRDIMSGGEGLNVIQLPVKQNLVINDLLEARETIMNSFLTEIGIQNANLSKRERLITDEVNANNQETKATVQTAFENIQKSMQRVNSISNLNLKVKLNLPEEVNVNVNDEINPIRNG